MPTSGLGSQLTPNQHVYLNSSDEEDDDYSQTDDEDDEEDEMEVDTPSSPFEPPSPQDAPSSSDALHADGKRKAASDIDAGVPPKIPRTGGMQITVTSDFQYKPAL